MSLDPLGSSLWRNRGYLPHLDDGGLFQTVTFRLDDSLPRDVVERWSLELEQISQTKRRERLRRRIDRYLDSGRGQCLLRHHQVAETVERALLRFDGERYGILAWCIMPNHVHTLIQTKPGFPLASVVHSWKSYTAKAANRILERTGTFWQREYHDRFIRSQRHLIYAVRYIEANPVSAGLVDTPEAWRWSSARRRTLE